MKAAPFVYRRPATVAEALEMRRAAGEDARFLAGGQSLVPMMALRLARPTDLIDLNQVSALAGIQRRRNAVSIGAMTRQQELVDDPDLRQQVPLIGTIVRSIGHPGTRTRGTVGGSVCHADPAAELPAMLLALGAEVVLVGDGGRERRLPIDAFLEGHYETAIGPDELLLEVQVPTVARRRMGFSEIAWRSSDFAMAGAVVAAQVDDTGGLAQLRVVAFALGGRPQRLPEVESAVLAAGATPVAIPAAAALTAELVRPSDEPGASSGYRRRLGVVAVRRALEGLLEGAG